MVQLGVQPSTKPTTSDCEKATDTPQISLPSSPILPRLNLRPLISKTCLSFSFLLLFLVLTAAAILLFRPVHRHSKMTKTIRRTENRNVNWRPTVLVQRPPPDVEQGQKIQIQRPPPETVSVNRRLQEMISRIRANRTQEIEKRNFSRFPRFRP